MHDDPLVYFMGASPYSVTDVRRFGMTNTAESSLTYPRFMNLPNGDLLFLYRQGQSGNGDWYANAFDGHAWHKTTSSPLFGSTLTTPDGRQLSVNAYPSYFVMGRDGTYHVAIVWRLTPDVSTNFRLSYARTKDFSTWYGADGKPIIAPLLPNTAELVDDVGENNGLVNNPKISVDQSGSPMITYTKYDGQLNAVFLATINGGRWRSTKIADSEKLTQVRGGGSESLPSFSPVDIVNNSYVVHVNFPGEHVRTVELDSHMLSPMNNPTVGAPPKTNGHPSVPETLPEVQGLVSPQVQTVHADKDAPEAADVVLRWYTQPVHGDRPRICTSGEPNVCHPPPSPLVMFVH